MAIFMSIFITRNYFIVSNQLIVLEDEKISGIVKSLQPIVAINLSLGFEENYIENIGNTMNIHKEIVGIELLNNQKNIIYKNFKNTFNAKNTKVYKVHLEDALLKTSLGTMKVYYTFSSIYTHLLYDFLHFLFTMLLFFIFSLIISTLLIKQNLNSLQTLKEKMLNYKLNNNAEFKKMEYKNEVAIINNAAVEMLQHIEKEVVTRILYEKEIMQKNRLASMGEMLDNIAHQWRQPLMKMNGIFLNLDRMIELDKLDKEYLEHKITEASNTIYHMSQTIDAFRDFVNPNKEQQSFSIIETIANSLKFLQSSLENINITFEYDQQCNVYGMKNELLQVLISILTNSIEILEQKNIKNKEIIIHVITEDSSVVLSIEDNGGGLDETILESVFEPYFTTKYKSGGTGMGLYICKLIMTNSFKGTISAENTPHGAKFLLKLSTQNM